MFGKDMVIIMAEKGNIFEIDAGIINANELEFSVFCIENVAIKLGIKGETAYSLFTHDIDILNEYIIPNFEILHTQSKEYIVNDIIDYMKECGVLK